MNDDGTRRYGAYDFINRKVGCEKFSFCKDAEENDIEIPANVMDNFKILIDTL